MSKSLDRRINDIEQSMGKDTKDKVTDIGFIIPGEPVQQFGKTFEKMEDCLAYAEENDIPYEVETGPFGMDSYKFSTK